MLPRMRRPRPAQLPVLLGVSLAPLLLALAVPAQGPGALPAGARDVGALDERKLDELCRPLVDAGLSHGFAVGVIDGERTLVRGYGTTAPGGDAAPDGDTVYEIGSISKVFTGLLLADAVERGLAAPDDPVQRHLPEGIALARFGEEPVRLWHLATHTSGLPRMPRLRPSNPANPYADFDVAALHAALAEAPVRWSPGSRYEYSNLAVGLLGHVLALAAGAADYETLLRQRILEPLGMRDTAVTLSASMRERLAPPHDADGQPAHVWDLAALAGAGGIRSTVRDMLLFARAQLDGGAPAAQELRDGAAAPLARAIARSQRPLFATPAVAMACGWHFSDDRATLWHNGQTGGYHAFLAVRPAWDKAVVLLDNSSTGQIDGLGDRIMKHLLGLKAAPLALERPVEVAREVLERYVGVYDLQPGVKFDVTLRPAGLFAQLTGQQAFRIHPRSETEFFYRVVDASITFEVEGGAVRALVLHQDGRDQRCLRRDG